ncbi:ABC transporter ATP-binding protein [Wandonia haliotis]|uniref:ABC transporter ATP-binding protein n=1 Tax=Wandonia haliotis TaxID=574963 RepID=A0ABP3Y2T6_9FLAO
MLEVRNITKRYGIKLALDNVSAKFEPGKIHGILGPNGAGKTTLIRIINQIITPDDGGVYLNNRLMPREQLSSLGYLPEERGMYPNMTVSDFLLFMGSLRGLHKNESKAALDYWMEKFDIQEWRGKRIEELSKGMAQKVQFISTVFHNPDLLILDEPFSGFDPGNVKLMRGILREMKEEGKTILLSTHNMNSVEELCDHVVLIDKSKKVLEGTVQEVKGHHSEKLYAVQFSGNMIAFATALWTGFDLVDKKIIGENRYIARVRMVGDSNFRSLLETLVPKIDIEGAWEELPSMEEVFIRETTVTH